MHRFYAIIILLAVVLTMTATFTAWFLTTYQALMWRPEILRIINAEIYYNETCESWYLKITAVNIGEAPAEIYKLEVYNIETLNFKPPLIIKPSEQRDLHIKLSEKYIYGVTYVIKIYLKSGTLYTILERVIRVD